MDYFNRVTSRLTSQDFEILAYLAHQSATRALESKNKQEIASYTGFANGTIRKVILKLDMLCLIESIGEGRAFAYYLTNYGVAAFNQIVRDIETTNETKLNGDDKL